jgi:hypothetical protein
LSLHLQLFLLVESFYGWILVLCNALVPQTTITTLFNLHLPNTQKPFQANTNFVHFNFFEKDKQKKPTAKPRNGVVPAHLVLHPTSAKNTAATSKQNTPTTQKKKKITTSHQIQRYKKIKHK